MDNTRVVFQEMPSSIRGFSTYVIDNNGERFYTIFLNPIFSAEKLQETYIHELEHIKNGDYDCECDISLLEEESHRYSY